MAQKTCSNCVHASLDACWCHNHHRSIEPNGFCNAHFATNNDIQAIINSYRRSLKRKKY